MDETYASNVDNLNERLREYKQAQVDKASSLLNSATEKYNRELAEYQDKWKAVQEGGQDEVAAQMGLKGVYQGGKKVYEIYKKYKGTKAGADTDDEDEEEDKDDGSSGGAEGDPQAQQLDNSNPTRPLTDEDRANIQDPMKDARDFRQATQDRMNARLKELGFGEDDSSAPSASGSASQAPADTGGGTDDADVSQARATAEGATDLPEPTLESAFGDLSSIPERGTASYVLWKLDAQAATDRGGNVGKGGSARGQTDASDASQSSNPPTSEGQPASGSATEGGNGAPTQQSQSSYNPEGAQANQSRNLDQSAGTDDVTGQPKVPSTKPPAPSGDDDINPLDADLPKAPALEEGGSFLGDFLSSDAAAAAIPVVGEAAAFVGGLVAIGEGIYHLFHPPAKKMPTAPVAGTLVPQSVSAKYANALPSFDSSSDNVSSDAVF